MPNRTDNIVLLVVTLLCLVVILWLLKDMYIDVWRCEPHGCDFTVIRPYYGATFFAHGNAQSGYRSCDLLRRCYRISPYSRQPTSSNNDCAIFCRAVKRWRCVNGG